MPLLALRALGEEAILMAGLQGYREYASAVRFPLVARRLVTGRRATERHEHLDTNHIWIPANAQSMRRYRRRGPTGWAVACDLRSQVQTSDGEVRQTVPGGAVTLVTSTSVPSGRDSSTARARLVGWQSPPPNSILARMELGEAVTPTNQRIVRTLFVRTLFVRTL
jgi:hypothetical protein